MKALKMTKWHSLAMAAALCCGTFSVTSHAADAAVTPTLSTGAERIAGQVAAPVQPVTLQEYLRIVVQNQPALAADRMQLGSGQGRQQNGSNFFQPGSPLLQ